MCSLLTFSPLGPPFSPSHIQNHRRAAQASKSIDNLGRGLTVIHHNTCNDNVISHKRGEWCLGLILPSAISQNIGGRESLWVSSAAVFKFALSAGRQQRRNTMVFLGEMYNKCTTKRTDFSVFSVSRSPKTNCTNKAWRVSEDFNSLFRWFAAVLRSACTWSSQSFQLFK